MIQHLEFFRKPILLHALENFSTLAQDGCLRLGVGFVRLRNQNITLIGFDRKWKIKVKKWKPCLKNFSEVTSQKLALGKVEESQGFSAVKNSKYKNGFFTMYSLNLKLSRTIFSFPIGWAETKIFGFEDFGLEVERSQLVGPKISKWVFSHLFPLPHRTHSNWWNYIWMSRTHLSNFQRYVVCQWSGKMKSHKKIAWKLQMLKTF